MGLPFGLPFICVPGKEGAAVMHDAGRERERERWNDKFVHDMFPKNNRPTPYINFSERIGEKK